MFISDAADLHDQLAAVGVKVPMPPTENSTEFRIEDTDGHVLRIFPS